MNPRTTAAEAPQEPFLTRGGSTEYIEQKYGKEFAPSEKTLANLASTGGGPEYYLINGRAAYTREALDAWMHSRMKPRRSTSDVERVS